jgi:alkylated DNA repair dioxygenase AlkB
MPDTPQSDLFDASPSIPEGFVYVKDFITSAEEDALLDTISQLPLQEASYRQWTAKRRIVSYGGRYDFSHHRLHAAESVPYFLHNLRAKLAVWAQLPAADLSNATIAEYQPSTQLGWHRDVPDFEAVLGVSLAGFARMRFRPYPPRKGLNRTRIAVELDPRSAYAIRGNARWGWQHAISPTRGLRYSITFRTLSRQ